MEKRLDPRHLMTAQETIAATLAGSDVAVVFDSETPWTDLKTKTIHLRPIPDQLDPEAIEDLRGDCDHELGHIIHTDPEAIVGIKRQLVKSIAFSIEDGRVERLIGAEWIGCGENLERSSKRAVLRIGAESEDDEANRRARAVCGLSLIAYGWDALAAVDALGADIEHYYEDLGVLINFLGECGSTSEVVSLAETIIDRWKWAPTGKSRAKSKGAKENAVAKEISSFSLSPATDRKQLLKTIGSTDVCGSYRAKTDRDVVEPIRPPSLDLGRLYGLFFEGVRQTAPILRRRLMMQFRSTGHRTKSLQKKGKLDERNLWRSGIGDDRLYKVRTTAQTNRSIVTIMVDCSASMTRAARPPAFEGEALALRTRLFVAAQAAAAVSSSLDALGVPNEVLAFSTAKRTPGAQLEFDRVRPIRHLIIKPFHKSFQSCRSKFMWLAFFEHCSENIDGEAVLWASRRILSRPNRGDRPVLMVFSDGEPASSPESNAVLAQHLRKSIKRAEASGITIFGIGIGSDAVRSFYDTSVIVSDVSNLLSTFYDLIKKVLQERRTSRV